MSLFASFDKMPLSELADAVVPFRDVKHLAEVPTEIRKLVSLTLLFRSAYLHCPLVDFLATDAFKEERERINQATFARFDVFQQTEFFFSFTAENFNMTESPDNELAVKVPRFTKPSNLLLQLVANTHLQPDLKFDPYKTADNLYQEKQIKSC